MHRGKQHYMYLLLVHTCPVLPDSYEFQSLCNLAWAGYFTLGGRNIKPKGYSTVNTGIKNENKNRKG